MDSPAKASMIKGPSRGDKILKAMRLQQEAVKGFTILGLDDPATQSKKKEVDLSDFEIISKIGHGQFGSVFLVRHKKSKLVLAMKRMKKKENLEKNEIDNIMTERDILTKTMNYPWLVSLYYSFQDERYLYLVMEFAAGGDLGSLFTTVGRFTEQQAKFYIAEMIVGVGCLHKLGYIHRDIKPDNFLISKSGHLMLADFGLSTFGSEEKWQKTAKSTGNSQPRDITLGSLSRHHKPRRKAYSIVGSPDYIAYEVVMGEGYDYTVDWWAIGVCLFELVVGVGPFDADTCEQVFENICDFKYRLKALENSQFECDDEIEISLSPECWDLLKKLICKPKKRLGKNGDFEEILKHPFFSDLNWKNLQPPFVPHLENDCDLSYFNLEGLDINDEEDDIVPPENKKKNFQKQNLFKNFDFKRDERHKKPDHNVSLQSLMKS